jgi:succinate dehydrogenase / fumarate reductase cytochrome b subunit
MKGVFGGRLAFDPKHATGSLVHHIGANWAIAFLIYPIGILASAYHAANGFRIAGITWGLTISAAGQRRWGRICVGLGVLLLVCGVAALFAAIHNSSHI